MTISIKGDSLSTLNIPARAVAPRSWIQPATHFERALSDPWYRHVVELTDLFHSATVDFWRGRGVRAAYLPVTTGSISSPMGLGSDSSPVPVEVMGTKTYLADSMQFLLEYACRLSPAGAYYVMPSFRGEAADSTHLCQFYHSEAEIPGGFEDVLAVVEAYVRWLSEVFLEQAPDLVAHLAGDVKHLHAALGDESLRRFEFDEAVRLLDNDPALVVTSGVGRSLTRMGEKRLMQQFGDFVWVTHMDHLSVPFYQAYGDTDGRTALSGDLLFGIGETVGCGERHADAGQARTALAAHGVDASDYDWYLRMRELTPLQTSGFGMGVERYLLWLLQHDEIRDIPLLLRFNGQQIDP